MSETIFTSGEEVKRLKLGFGKVPLVMYNKSMRGEPDYPYAEQGRRLRWLRQAERIESGIAFAAKMGWGQSGYSQFEKGVRSMPAIKAVELARKIPGFDPLWLWEGDKRGLSFDLRRRIEAEEAKESPISARGKRQNVTRK